MESLTTRTNKQKSPSETNSVSISRPAFNRTTKGGLIQSTQEKTDNTAKKECVYETLASKNAEQIFEIVKNDFEHLSDDQIYHLLKRTDLEHRTHKDIKWTLWSWVNILEYDKDKMNSICKDEFIKFNDSDHVDDYKFHQTYTSSPKIFKHHGSMFSCDREPIYILSDKMLDKALEMKRLNALDLQFILDNYITGEGKIDNLDVTFDTYEKRNKIFQHSVGVKNVNMFMSETICNYMDTFLPPTLPDSEKQNSIQKMIGKDLNDENVRNFISPKSAQIAYEDFINNYKRSPHKSPLDTKILYSPYIFTHKNIIKSEDEGLIANALYNNLIKNINNNNETENFNKKIIKQIFQNNPSLKEKINSSDKTLLEF